MRTDPLTAIKVFGITVIVGVVLAYVTSSIMNSFTIGNAQAVTITSYNTGIWAIVPILFAVLPVLFGILFVFS